MNYSDACNCEASTAKAGAVTGEELPIMVLVDPVVQIGRVNALSQFSIRTCQGRAVAEALDRGRIAEHGKPGSITVDHGTAFTSRVFNEWRTSRV